MQADTKTVFNLKIATQLIKLGFKPINVELNKEDNNYLVFKFPYTEKLMDKFNQLKEEHIEMRGIK